VPAGPDDPQPGTAEDADGLGVALAAGAGVGIQLGRPGGAVAGVVGEDVQGLAGVAVGGHAEPDAAGLARGASDRSGIRLSGGLVGAASPVQDRAELGQQLGEGDLAGVGQGGEQGCLGWVARCF
jgi:hypothetical protein